MTNTLTVFSYRVIEARTAFRDPDEFWAFGAHLSDDEIYTLNRQILKQQVREIRPMGDSQWIVTCGDGFHYYVEAMVRCPFCGYQIVIDEASMDTTSCQECRPSALDEIAAGF